MFAIALLAGLLLVFFGVAALTAGTAASATSGRRSRSSAMRYLALGGVLIVIGLVGFGLRL